MSQKLYCPECGEYLMAGDGECHDCSCGWKQFVPAMKRFRVELNGRLDVRYIVDVEAADEEAAGELAMQQAPVSSAFWECLEQTVGDVESDVIEEVE
jgi:hypothetical protein